MADEKDTAPAMAGTDDADLSAAWEQEISKAPVAAVAVASTEKKDDVPVQTTEPKVAETAPAETLAAAEIGTPEEQKKRRDERADIGRKFKAYKEETEQWKQQVSAQLAALKGTSPADTTQPQEETEPEVITTWDDVKRNLEREQHEKTVNQKKYESEYLNVYDQLTAADPEDLQNDIWVKIRENDGRNEYNLAPSGKPDIDAQINYAKAKAAVLSDRLSSNRGSSVPARNTASAPPVQPAAAATHTPKPTVVMPKFDPVTDSFVAYLRSQGTPDDEILATIGGQ